MDITITLPAELGMKAKEAAARQGWNLEEYVITAVELALEKLSLDEILAPVRRQFAESGMTEEELTALVKEERHAMWLEKHGETTE
ncbi:MAG: hypothetical protein MOB07_08500 [Acidobacteria bacterium]|nr:hypothetical protein [Acidobacteriota bacterium]